MVAIVLVLLSGLLPAAVLSADVISVTDSNELERYLCGNRNNSLASGTTLELSSNVLHHLNFSQQQFCILENLVDLTITSNSSSLAVIQCDPVNVIPLNSVGGLGFFNMQSLRLLNLKFIHCGGVIPSSALRLVNDSESSPFYIIPAQQAVLIFNHCRDLLISNVNITRFNGFGVLAINLHGLNTTINNLFVSLANWVSSNGAMFYFFDSELTNSSVNVYVTGVRFTLVMNLDQYDLSKLYFSQKESRLPLVGSAGVSFIFAQSYSAAVTLDGATSFFNTGSISGGAFVLFLNNFRNSTLYIHRFTATDNLPIGTSGSCGLLVHFACSYSNCTVGGEGRSWVPLKIINSTFTRNSPEASTHVLRDGAIAITQFWAIKNVSIFLSKVAFYNNTSNLPDSCGCVCAKYMYLLAEIPGQSVSNGISLYLEDIVATYNGGEYPTSSTAIFLFKGLGMVTFSVLCLLITMIKARLTPVYLQDEMTFENNKGLQGPVFQISELAYLVLTKSLNATFISNIAYYYGGVLYSDTTGDAQLVCYKLTQLIRP